MSSAVCWSPGAASIAAPGRCLREQQMTRSEQQTRHGKPAVEEAAGSFLKKCPTNRTDRSATMTSYRVNFMNEFARNRRVHKVCQRSIVVRSARSSEQAAEAAKAHFAKLEGHSRLTDSCRDDRGGAVRKRSGFGYKCARHGSAIKRRTSALGDRRLLRNSAQAQGGLPALAFDRVNRLSRKPNGNQLSIASIELTFLQQKDCDSLRDREDY
jgi:hypothetical protein